jgi:hypothetical protein
MFNSGFQVNFYYDFDSITEENLESVSRIETLVYSALSSQELNNFEIRSSLYQNSFELVNGEEEIYSRE